MKCEIKLLNKYGHRIVEDFKTNRHYSLKLLIISILIAIPISILNEIITPKTDYINITVIGGLAVWIYVILYRRCKNDK